MLTLDPVPIYPSTQRQKVYREVKPRKQTQCPLIPLGWPCLVQSLSRVLLFATSWTQHPRPPCPSPTPGVYLWCHPTISSSVVPFFSAIKTWYSQINKHFKKRRPWLWVGSIEIIGSEFFEEKKKNPKEEKTLLVFDFFLFFTVLFEKTDISLFIFEPQ